MDRSSMRPRARLLTAWLSTFVLVGVAAAVVPSAHAVVATCQGEAATIEGPTDGLDTTGTEGDDVIVAPLVSDGVVSGLGGDDTICLVQPNASVSARIGSDNPSSSVVGGPGDDLVVNETTIGGLTVYVRLGAGADHFVGGDTEEVVSGSDATPDAEVDIIDTRHGVDKIYSGSPGHANHDVILTGSGNDDIHYAGLAGGAIDNGPGVDSLSIRGSWTGQLSIDNVAGQATIGGAPVLTWTAVDAFHLRARPGSPVSFLGSGGHELLSLSGSVRDFSAPSADIETGGGDDQVLLKNYLPHSVDLGAGFDDFNYLACEHAVVKLTKAARCESVHGGQAVTSLAGIDSFWGRAKSSLDVTGTPARDLLIATARSTRVSGLAGDDVVRVFGHKAVVRGGRGSDLLLGQAIKTALTTYGGRGNDVLRGSYAPDRLFGGKGDDAAYGKAGGVDFCVAEKRVGCELP